MKKIIQAFLQRLLGFENYLLGFSLLRMKTLRWSGSEADFFHFLELLGPEEVVLDIGANIGIMTGLLAKQCPQGRILAFEPVPDNFKALERVVQALKADQVQRFNLALGEEAKTVELMMPVMAGVRMQGLSHVNHGTIAQYPHPYVHYEVEQVALDEFGPLENLRVTAIKMDVENYEQFVLRGAKALIARDLPLIYCELWDNENRQVCMEMLGTWGYQAKVKEGKVLVNFDKKRHLQQNFFFFPPNK